MKFIVISNDIADVSKVMLFFFSFSFSSFLSIKKKKGQVSLWTALDLFIQNFLLKLSLHSICFHRSKEKMTSAFHLKILCSPFKLVYPILGSCKNPLFGFALYNRLKLLSLANNYHRNKYQLCTSCRSKKLGVGITLM